MGSASSLDASGDDFSAPILNGDVWALVREILAFKDRAQLRRTCRYFKAVDETFPYLPVHPKLDNVNEDGLQTLARVLKRFGITQHPILQQATVFSSSPELCHLGWGKDHFYISPGAIVKHWHCIMLTNYPQYPYSYHCMYLRGWAFDPNNWEPIDSREEFLAAIAAVGSFSFHFRFTVTSSHLPVIGNAARTASGTEDVAGAD